jgi:hypothetical protein
MSYMVWTNWNVADTVDTVDTCVLPGIGLTCLGLGEDLPALGELPFPQAGGARWDWGYSHSPLQRVPFVLCFSIPSIPFLSFLNHSVKYLEALHIFRFHPNIWIHNDSYINIPSRNRKSAGTGNSSLRLDWAPCCSSQQSGQTQSSVVGGRYDTTLDRTHGRQSKMHWNLAAQGHDTLTRNCHRTNVNSTAKKRNNMKHCETTTWTQLATFFFFQTKDAARWISNKAGLDASISLVSFHGAQMLWDGSHACCPISIAWHVHSKKLWLFAYSAVVLCATGG